MSKIDKEYRLKIQIIWFYGLKLIHLWSDLYEKKISLQRWDKVFDSLLF